MSRAAGRRRRLKEPLIKSSADYVAGKMRLNARRATKVVARTTTPRSATLQTPHFAATRRDGAFRAVCFVARLAKGSGHWLRLASRIPSRKASVATAWDLIRGSLYSQGSVEVFPKIVD